MLKNRPGELHIRTTQVSDITPLKGMPLELLDMGNTRVSDVSVLAGMPLNTLGVDNCQIADLRPIADCKMLEKLSLPKLEADVSFLRGLNNLKQVDDDGGAYWEVQTSAEDFWKKHEARFAPRRAIDTALAKMNVPDIRDRAQVAADGMIDLDLHALPVRDLSLLSGLPIQSLDISRTLVTDISPLVGMPLKVLDAKYCTEITDFEPLTRIQTLEKIRVV